jgi:hypothetical protein
MTCSVLQTNLEPPTVEQLKAAFSQVPGLTAMDAFTFGRDALGILSRAMEPDRARALQSAFAAQGVETEVVDDASLPPLPEMRMVHKLDPTPDALMICDPLGRSFPLPWPNVMLIAAGLVRMTEFKTDEVPVLSGPNTDGGFGGYRSSGVTLTYQKQTHEERNDRWLLDIVITGGALRYYVTVNHPDNLPFHYLNERRTRDLATNFKLLVQDQIASAPNAAVNRGAYYLRENSSQPFRYNSKTSFYNEMTWLLWKIKTAPPAA